MRKLLFVSLMSFSSLFGFSQVCPGELTIEGDYLYLKPNVGPTYFATTDTLINSSTGDGIGPNGEMLNNDLEFSSGFRVGVFYGLCECPVDIRGYYTRLTSNRTTDIGPQDGLLPSSLYPFRDISDNLSIADQGEVLTLASSSLGLTYQRGDALMALEVHRRPCESWINIVGGFEIFSVNLDEEYYSTVQEQIPGDDPSTAIFNPINRQNVFGIGPELGFESKYSPCWPWPCSRFVPDCLSFVSSGSFSLLATRNKPEIVGKELRANATPRVFSIQNVTGDSSWGVSWAAHMQLGVTVEKPFQCLHTVFEIGYEFDFYSQVLNRSMFTVPQNLDDNSPYGPMNSQNFSLQGLYISGKISF
jgi:hypothetical protein